MSMLLLISYQEAYKSLSWVLRTASKARGFKSGRLQGMSVPHLDGSQVLFLLLSWKVKANEISGKMNKVRILRVQGARNLGASTRRLPLRVGLRVSHSRQRDVTVRPLAAVVLPSASINQVNTVIQSRQKRLQAKG